MKCPCSTTNEANSVNTIKNVKVINLRKNENAEDLKDKLSKMFKSTISDELSAKPMNAPPMKIYLHKESYRPVRTTTARSVPKRFEAPAKSAVQDLLKKGVITRVSTPTEYQNGRSTRVLPIGPGRTKFLPHNLPPTLRQVQIPQTPHGTLGKV